MNDFRKGASHFIDEVEEVFETNWDLEVNKFDDMGLKESVLRGIYGYGFKDPSPI
jgi:translation initiation factor 4A